MKLELVRLIKRTLNENVPLLELRGADSHARQGGDLDFIVPNGCSVKACNLTAQAAIKEGWLLLGFRDIGYLAQIILVRPADDGFDQAVKIDFFDGLRWYGVGEDNAARLLFQKLFSSQNDALRLAGAVNFFQRILITGRVDQRHMARVSETGADTNYLVKTGNSFGLKLTESHVANCYVPFISKWRLRAQSGGVSGFLSTIIWFFKATAAHLKFKLGVGTKTGLVVGISGLDGSGKSTLIKRVLVAYRRAGGEPPTLSHMLPNWIPMPHQIFRRRKTRYNYTRPYSEPPVSSRINGWFRLVYYLFAFTIVKLVLSLVAKRGRVIILDRSFLDFATDVTRSRIPAVHLPQWLLRALTPNGQFFYLDASPKIVVARKGELTIEKANSLRDSYRMTCKAVGAIPLNADNSPNDLFREFLSHISAEYLQRSLTATTKHGRSS